jgi:hypothetical protein
MNYEDATRETPAAETPERKSRKKSDKAVDPNEVAA